MRTSRMNVGVAEEFGAVVTSVSNVPERILRRCDMTGHGPRFIDVCILLRLRLRPHYHYNTTAVLCCAVLYSTLLNFVLKL